MNTLPVIVQIRTPHCVSFITTMYDGPYPFQLILNQSLTNSDVPTLNSELQPKKNTPTYFCSFFFLGQTLSQKIIHNKEH